MDPFVVFKEEFGDSSGVYFIGFSLSEGYGFVEVRDKDRVYEYDSEVVGDEEGEEINMVVAAGFKSDDDIFAFCHFSEGRFEFLEVFEVLVKFEGSDNIAIDINNGGIKGVKGDIDTYEVFKHGITSCSFKGGRRPSIPSSGLIGGSLDPTNSLGIWKVGDRLLHGLLAQEKCCPPASLG